MRRSAIFLTVAGLALPLSASAQDAQFSVYGTLLPFVDNFHTTGATAPGPAEWMRWGLIPGWWKKTAKERLTPVRDATDLLPVGLGSRTKLASRKGLRLMARHIPISH